MAAAPRPATTSAIGAGGRTTTATIAAATHARPTPTLGLGMGSVSGSGLGASSLRKATSTTIVTAATEASHTGSMCRAKSAPDSWVRPSTIRLVRLEPGRRSEAPLARKTER